MLKILITFLLFSLHLTAADREEIRQKITNTLTSLSEKTNAGILIFNPLTQDTIYSLNCFQTMIPASNTKLFTTSVALASLGGDFKISLKLFTDDTYFKDGVINGNIYLKGFGNAAITENDLLLFVNHLRELGISNITGNIVGDESYFDDAYYRADWIDDEISTVKLSPISALVIDRNQIITFKKRGRRTKKFIEDVKQPALFAANLLKVKLENAEITVSGSVIQDITPKGVNQIDEISISLREFVSLINKHSDNYLAECLFKIIGAEYSNIEGNSFYATQAILNFLDENNIFSQGTEIVDGSGISRFDKVTPATIAGVLEAMYFGLNTFEDFYNSLSVAGVDGTLRSRFIGSNAENNFHGKTGTLNGVTSLSGYIKTKGNDDLIISMIFEYQKGSSRSHKNIEDDIIIALSEME